ncbi:MAG TPA: potassium transporter TrkG [Spirochaetota bacterium]|nr:potassium transporter TrkG [Spirochaetota bacterium]
MTNAPQRSIASPIFIVLFSFIALILVGAALLSLPFATHRGINPIDALFTSTSAVCVTGLIVLDTAKDFTFWGQLIILTLIQFGGFGIMTFSLALLSFAGGSVSIKWRFTMGSFYNEVGKIPIRSLLKRIVFYTLTIEALVALSLMIFFSMRFPVADAAWHAVFHSVSAFCNAGFSTFSDNLAGFHDHYAIQLLVCINIVLGGLGFIVLDELVAIRFRIFGRKKFSTLTVHTRLSLVITGACIALGTVAFLLIEWKNVLQPLSLSQKFMASLFQSITARTAGFNTVDIGALRPNTLFMLIILMFTGGCPGGIAGGVKTTTVGVIALQMYNKFKGNESIVIWGRSIDRDTIDRCMTLVVISIITLSASTFLFQAFDDLPGNNSYLAAAFEVTSAFGTVGLSTGITPQLSDMNKLLLCAVMYVGRLGPLTLMMAIASRVNKTNVHYPKTHIMTG